MLLWETNHKAQPRKTNVAGSNFSSHSSKIKWKTTFPLWMMRCLRVAQTVSLFEGGREGGGGANL